MSDDSPPAHGTINQPRPFQFHLGQLLILIAVLSLVLALTTQWKHVGFVLACFLVGVIVGGWRRHDKLLIASLAGLAVYVATFAASWVSLGTAHHMDHAHWIWDEMAIAHLDHELGKHYELHGEYPSSLGDIDNQNPFVNEAGQPVNRWNHPLSYRRTETGYDLASLGRDGRMGGAGFDADYYSRGSETAYVPSRLPAREFLFETEGSTGVFWAAVITAVIAANIGWQIPKSKASPRAMLLATLVTVVAASIVAFFLAAFYVVVSNASGH